MALSDGTLVLVAGNELIRTDRAERHPSLGWGDRAPAGTGQQWNLLCDGANLRVYFADFADWQPYAFLSLEKESYDMDDCTDLWVTRDGDALLLVNGQQLLLDRGSTVSDLTGMLYRSPAQCVLILAGLALAVLILTTLLWFLVYDQRRLRLPLLVRWGRIGRGGGRFGNGGAGAGNGASVSAEHASGSVQRAGEHHGAAPPDDSDQRPGRAPAAGGQPGPGRGGLFYDTAVSVYSRMKTAYGA